jgi:type IV pilus assembly protein PilV
MKRMYTNRESGLSLIEVLIALAVISIGLAGMAAMQLTTLQFVHSAHYRSMASTVALDFEERLWLELANDGLTGCPNVSDAAGSPAEALLDHWSRDYVGGQGAEDWNWSSARMLKVPNLTITMGTPVTGMASVTQIPVTLSWNENRFSDVEATTETFTYNVRILCRAVEEEEET